MKRNFFLLISLLFETNLFINSAESGLTGEAPECKSFKPMDLEHPAEAGMSYDEVYSGSADESLSSDADSDNVIDEPASDSLTNYDPSLYPQDTLMGQPYDPIYFSFNFLPNKQLRKLACTCKKANQIATKVILNRYLSLSPEKKNNKLLSAAKNGKFSTVNLLLQAKANMNIQNHRGTTAFILASIHGHRTIVKLLLEKGANIEIQNELGETALMKASRNGHRAIAELFLEKSANIEIQNLFGDTALMMTSRNGHRAIVELLLEKGANIDTQDEHGETALMKASKNGNRAIVELLLEKGANIDTQDQLRYTALMKASRDGHREIAQILRQEIERRQMLQEDK